jgi:hypothetical protein
LSTTPSRGTIARAAVAVSLLALVLLTVFAAGCSNDTTTTTATSPVTTTDSNNSTTTTPVTLPDLDKQLARTSKAQNALARTIEDLKVPDDNPWLALSYALHARAQAIGCVQMLKKGDKDSLGIADGVMRDIYQQLNFARDLATGTAAQTIAAARAIADKIGAPSDHVGEALDLLDQFVQALSPLWDELEAVYTQVIADQPAYLGGYVNLAQLLYERGDKNGAVAIVDKGIAATSGDDKTTLEKLKQSLTGVTTT